MKFEVLISPGQIKMDLKSLQSDNFLHVLQRTKNQTLYIVTSVTLFLRKLGYLRQPQISFIECLCKDSGSEALLKASGRQFSDLHHLIRNI